MHLHWDEGAATKRSYSGDGSAPVRQIEIAVSYVEGGTATKLLGELEHGVSIEASSPSAASACRKQMRIHAIRCWPPVRA